ncbi:MAG: ATP-binding protein [Balneolaceae bacterium]|nr:ATP-binding protein [Balneolaceae bacterium]
MANPFHYERLPAANDLCGRSKETGQLAHLITEGKNIVLFGDRHYGKSSLIENVFRKLPEDRLHSVANLYACVESRDVAVCLYEAVYKALPFNLERKLKEFSAVFKQIRLGLEVTPTRSPKITTQLLSQEFEQLIEDVLTGAEQLCKNLGFSLVIVLDEFQQIAQIKDAAVDSVLRTHMHRLKCVSFIFTGFRKSILSGLFFDEKKPLYGMATSVAIGGIEPGLFKPYLEKRLGQSFEIGAFEQLYDEVRGQTGLIVQSCYTLYARGRALTKDYVNEALERIIADKDEEFKMLFNSYANQQKKAIKMIGRYQGRHLFSQQCLTEFRIKKQSLNQVLARLIESGDVAQSEDGRYFVSDVSFHLWVIRKFR